LIEGFRVRKMGLKMCEKRFKHFHMNIIIIIKEEKASEITRILGD